MSATKGELQSYYRQALERCLDTFRRLSEDDWRRKASKVWTAKDYLAHLVGFQEGVGNRLTAQALAGQPPDLPGFTNRAHIDDFNELLLAPLRHLSVEELLSRFQSAFQEHLGMLEPLSEEELERSASSPGWGQPGTVRDLFHMCYLHLPAHYQDIRRAAKKAKLPHWTEACTPQELNFLMARTFHFMALLYHPERGGDLKATFLFTMEGEGGGQWAIRVEEGRARAQDGAPEHADVEIRTRPSVWMDLATKDLSATMAVMSRKVHISGNPALAMRLDFLFFQVS